MPGPDRRPTRRPPRRCGCGGGRRPPAGRRGLAIASMRPGQSGAVARLPFDAYGLAPSIEQVVGAVDVGDRDGERRAEHQPGGDLLGPLVDGAGREHVGGAERPDQRAGRRAGRRGCGRSGCRGRRRRPRGRARSITGSRRCSTSANASSQVASTNTPSRFTSGVRHRSGSSWSCLRVEPFGQMKPWLNTSSRSPRMRVDLGAVRPAVISRPQPASQSGQVRKAVRVGLWCPSDGASAASSDVLRPQPALIGSPSATLSCPYGPRRYGPGRATAAPRAPMTSTSAGRYAGRPTPPPDRPWVLVNMVASADGGDGGRRARPAGSAGRRPTRVFPPSGRVADVILAGGRHRPGRELRPAPRRRRAPGRAQARGQAANPRLAVVVSSARPRPRLVPLPEAEDRPLVVTTADAAEPTGGPRWPRWPTSSRPADGRRRPRRPRSASSPRSARRGRGRGRTRAQRAARGRRAGRRAVPDARPHGRRRQLGAHRASARTPAPRDAAARAPARGGRRRSSSATSGPEATLEPASVATPAVQTSAVGVLRRGRLGQQAELPGEVGRIVELLVDAGEAHDATWSRCAAARARPARRARW